MPLGASGDSGFCPAEDGSARSSAHRHHPVAALDDPGGHIAGRAGADDRDRHIEHENPDSNDRGDRHRDVEAHRGAGDHQRKGGIEAHPLLHQPADEEQGCVAV